MNLFPKVSVVTITYGHEKYITQTLNSVLMQNYRGDIEFIIANDHSPDATDKVIKEYLACRSIPDNFTVKYTQHEFNKGMMSNFIWALEQASGKYIAFCEGDDYWTDPAKLQKQIDFLELNDDYSLVCTNFHSCDVVAEYESNKEITFKDILHHSAIGSLTVLFRTSILSAPKTSIFEKEFSMCDYQLWLLIATHSRIYKLGDITGFYRVLQDSASGRNDYRKKIKYDLDVLEITKFYLKSSELTALEKREILRERYGYLFSTLIQNRDTSFLHYQWIYFKDVKFFNLLDFKILLRGVKVYF